MNGLLWCATLLSVPVFAEAPQSRPPMTAEPQPNLTVRYAALSPTENIFQPAKLRGQVGVEAVLHSYHVCVAVQKLQM